MRGRIGTGCLVVACAVAQADPAPVPTFAPPLAEPTAASTKKSPEADQPLRLRIPLGTVVNVHLNEAVVLDAIAGPSEERLLRRLLRDRTNWEEHAMDPRPLTVLRAAMTTFGARRVEIVSGYRSDKLNEMLRKKGRHVARQSQHVLGCAVDFRLVGVETRDLLRFVRANHRGGVGFYPSSGFVHVDSGRRRQWRGE
ncbi:MAG: DUF882 domain-containing protein [Polyangiales bacterium]